MSFVRFLTEIREITPLMELFSYSGKKSYLARKFEPGTGENVYQEIFLLTKSLISAIYKLHR